MVDSSVPRRCQLEHMTPAERAIYDAMGVVEAAGCDVRLTEAVILLQRARDRVADFVDGVEGKAIEYENQRVRRLEENHQETR